MSREQRRRLRADSSAMLGLGVVIGLLLFAILGPSLTGDPNLSHFALARAPSGAPPPASSAHWLGTDPIFRDVLARLAHGARVSLGIALVSTLIAVTLGALLGIVAGYLADTRHGYLDSALMRLVDVALAFPYLLLITAIGVAIDRADGVTVTLILGLTSWTGIARITRTRVLQLKATDFVTAARALGAGPLRIMLRHLLPGVTPTLVIIGTHAIAQLVLAEAVLGYLTVGIEPPQATWGRMLQEAESYIGVAPLLVAAPSGLILLAALGFTRLGDGLQEAVDPQLARLGAGRGRGRLVADAVVFACVVGAILLSGTENVAAPLPVAAPSAAPLRGGVLHVASTTAAPGLDPAVAYDEASQAIDDLIFARLVTHDTSGRLVPELAASFEIVEAKRFVFHLRGGLRFHDGANLLAADVKRSLERSLDTRSSCPAAHAYRNIVGYEAFREDSSVGLAGVTTPDDHTVEITLTGPDASFLSLLTLGFAAPVCPSSGTFVDAKRPTPPCGAGPFELAELEVGRRTFVTRFEHYHEAGKPYLDAVEWLENVPARTQRYRFEQGELDIITELTGIDSFRYADDPAWEGHRFWVPKPATNFIFLNTQMAPFDNVHLRRAVALGVDPSVLDRVRANVGSAAWVIPSAVPGPPQDEPMRHHDLAAARHEMDLAGYRYDPATDEGGYPELIDYVTIPNTFDQAAGEIFQQQLKRVGLRLRLKLVSWASWVTLITEPGRVPMGWRGWAADYPDPITCFAPILTTEAITEQGSQNVSFYSNPELDAIIRRTATTLDHTARMDLFAQAERIVMDDAPVVPVYAVRSLHLVQPVVGGYTPHPVVPLRVRDVWLNRGTR